MSMRYMSAYGDHTQVKNMPQKDSIKYSASEVLITFSLQQLFWNDNLLVLSIFANISNY